jgi:hypothetical protein
MSFLSVDSVFIQATVLISPSDRFSQTYTGNDKKILPGFLSHSEQPFYVHVAAVLTAVESDQCDGLTVRTGLHG